MNLKKKKVLNLVREVTYSKLKQKKFIIEKMV